MQFSYKNRRKGPMERSRSVPESKPLAAHGLSPTHGVVNCSVVLRSSGGNGPVKQREVFLDGKKAS